MAVTFSQHDQVELFGLSTDNKPTKDIPVGSTFEETDTKAKFKYNGSTWKTTTMGRVNAMPYGYDVAEGNIADHEAWSKYGFYSACGTTDIDLWAGGSSYTWLTAGQTVYLQSSSAADAAAGTGIRTVKLFYLNSAYESLSETITVTGTSIVTTVATSVYRINGLRAVTTGTSLVAAGNIDIIKSAGGTVLTRISSGYTRARNITYTVPTGKTLYLTSMTLGAHSATKGVRFILRTDYDSDTKLNSTFFMVQAETAMSNGALYRPFEIPLRCPQTTRIKVSTVCDAAGTFCTAVLRGWLES